MQVRTCALWFVQAAFLTAIQGCSREAAVPTEDTTPSQATAVPTLSGAVIDGTTEPPGSMVTADPAAVVSHDASFPALTNKVATTSALLNSFFNNVTPGSSRLLLSNSDVAAARRSTTDVIILARDYSDSPSFLPSAPQLTSNALTNLEAFLRQGGCVATEFSSNTLWFQNHNWGLGIGAPTLPTLAFSPSVGLEGGFLTEFDNPVDSHTVVSQKSRLVLGIPSTFADAIEGGKAGDLEGNLFGDLAGAGIKVVAKDSDESGGAAPVAFETIASASVDAGTAILMLADWQDLTSVNPAHIDPEIGTLWVNVANCPVAVPPELVFTVVFDATTTEPGSSDIVLYDARKLSTVPLPGLNRPKKADRNATISGNERYIAFVSSRSGATDVILYDRTTESIVPVPGMNDPSVFDGSPYLSEDGNLIAFDSKRSGEDDVYLYDRTAGLLLLPGLNSADSPDGSPALSTNGRYIAFESERDGTNDIFLYDRDLQSLVPLPGLNTGSIERMPTLAKNARLIAFESDRSGNGDIFLYDRDTQNLIGLPGLNSPILNDVNPSITSGGRYIAFETDRTGVPTILVYDRRNKSLLTLPGLDTPNLDHRPQIQ